MISVCIPTYNGASHIQAQLKSILPQLEENDEIIISDDHSTDGTISLIEEMRDQRIKIFFNQHKKGVIPNIENAIRKAAGNYIFLSDQDDVWLPNKLTIMKETLQTYNLVISDCKVVDKDLNVISESFYKINTINFGKYRSLLLKNPYLGCCMAFNKVILDKTLPFPKNLPMHDIWIGNIGVFFYNIKFINDKLLLYRRHDSNLSPTSHKSPYPLLNRIKFRLIVIYHLIKRFFK